MLSLLVSRLSSFVERIRVLQDLSTGVFQSPWMSGRTRSSSRQKDPRDRVDSPQVIEGTETAKRQRKITTNPSSSSHSSSSSTPTPSSLDEIPLVVSSIRLIFDDHRDPKNAEKMKSYMRDQFSYIGLKKPIRAALTKPLIDEWSGSYQDLDTLVHHLWQMPEREYQYFAMDLMSKPRQLKILNSHAPESLNLVERCIRQSSWWDTVDMLSSKLVGSIVTTNPHLLSTMDAWNEDHNLWIRRSSLLFQLMYKPPVLDIERQFRFVQNLMHEQDFFIRKAIGWVLRQHSKIDKKHQAMVSQFITDHQEKLSKLSIREGSKYLK